MYHYLIIDDEELIRKGTIKKLEPLKASVSCIGEADNGQSGIEAVASVHPDFVILDMQMPVMGGMELLPYLAEHYPDMPLIVISGYRDFDYIKQAISSNAVEYLLKPFSAEAIRKCVHQVIEQLAHNKQITNQLLSTQEEIERAHHTYDISLLRNVILGYPVNKVALTSEHLAYIARTHDFVLFTLYFTKRYPERPHEEISKWLQENEFADLVLHIQDEGEDPRQDFIVLFLPQENKASLHTAVSSMITSILTWAHTYEPEMLIGISKMHHALSELGTAYIETAKALDQRHLTNETREYFVFNADVQSPPLYWKNTDEFLFRIEEGRTDRVQYLLDALFKWYAMLPDCRLLDVKRHLYELSEDCRHIMSRYIPRSATATGSGLPKAARQLFTLQELHVLYKQFFTNLSEMLRPESIYSGDDTIEKIKIYLQRNYEKNLNQDFIASLFYLNRSYLSTQFKNQTGKKFIDYLNDIRIEKAEYLLQRTDQKMYQIARAVGYKNVKYFFRIFKKQVGMTPETYRERANVLNSSRS